MRFSPQDRVVGFIEDTPPPVPPTLPQAGPRGRPLVHLPGGGPHGGSRRDARPAAQQKGRGDKKREPQKDPQPAPTGLWGEGPPAWQGRVVKWPRRPCRSKSSPPLTRPRWRFQSSRPTPFLWQPPSAHIAVAPRTAPRACAAACGRPLPAQCERPEQWCWPSGLPLPLPLRLPRWQGCAARWVSGGGLAVKCRGRPCRRHHFRPDASFF